MMTAAEQDAPRLGAPVPWLPVRLVWGGFLVAAAAELRVPVALCHACRPGTNRRGVAADALTLRAHKARAIATYLAHTEAGFTQMGIAEALGLTRAAVCLCVQQIEDKRDDADFDRLIDRVARAVAGEGAP
jgi:hypothetical protein